MKEKSAAYLRARNHHKMHSKKAFEISIITLMGLVVAFLVIAFVITPLMFKAYSLLIQKPDYVSEQSYERIVYLAKNLGGGESALVPVQLGSFAITTNSLDNACTKNCICLCNNPFNKGCLSKIYKSQCFKQPIEVDGFISRFGGIDIIQISKLETGTSVTSGFKQTVNACESNPANVFVYLDVNKIQGSCLACTTIKKCEDYLYNDGACLNNRCGIGASCAVSAITNKCMASQIPQPKISCPDNQAAIYVEPDKRTPPPICLECGSVQNCLLYAYEEDCVSNKCNAPGQCKWENDACKAGS